MCTYIQEFKAIRQTLYDSFESRADAQFNLLDSLSGRQTAQSVVELSLEPLFKHQYSSVYDAVKHFFIAQNSENATEERQKKALERINILLPVLPKPSDYPFFLMGIDATPAPRPYANALSDRGITYYPNPAPGNKPIGVGHSYSILALLPERKFNSPPWVIPLSCARIATKQTANQVAVAQMSALLSDTSLPFGVELTVNVADSSYSKANYLSPISKFENHVEINRVAKNRKFYHIPPPADPHPGHGGRRKSFGVEFDLKNNATWGNPDEEAEISWKTHSGRKLQVKLQRWHDLLMHGKKDAPMCERPFDLIRCQVFDEQGNPIFKNILWLIVFGQRRREIDSVVAYEVYRQRYDLEHFFRFAKNKLLLDRNQTPETTREENWWEFACLAYTQLWLASPLSVALPKPWERNLPQWKEGRLLGPAQVQRDYGRIIQVVGTPVCATKPRGNSPGRKKGASPGKRLRQSIIFKSRSPPKMTAKQ